MQNVMAWILLHATFGVTGMSSNNKVHSSDFCANIEIGVLLNVYQLCLTDWISTPLIDNKEVFDCCLMYNVDELVAIFTLYFGIDNVQKSS